MFRRKPYSQCLAECESGQLQRTLSLWDLVCIGVGGTVGSGIFVLTGLIAHRYSGGGIVYSWLIAGVACAMSALSYAELSSLIPLGGSSYVYTYIALGELPAFLSACCLSLEYGIAGGAVSRSWSDKVEAWIDGLTDSNFATSTFIGGLKVNILAGIIQALVVVLVLGGVDLSKTVINSFTSFKVVLVIFIIIAGLYLYDPSNNPSWTPYGTTGILRGASSCFFGYVGYDEVCCMAGEAKDPRRSVPLGVIYTVCIVTVLYTLAGIALVGMQNYALISEDTGFSSAFASNHWAFAEHVVALGEILTLPIVVMVSFIAQPRVQFALAEDGLLPSLFSEIDRQGNLRKSIIVTGIICTFIALFIPFQYLDDLISGGVLISFNFTNTSIILSKFDMALLSINPRSNSYSNNNNSNNSSSSNSSNSSNSNIGESEDRSHFIYRYMSFFHLSSCLLALFIVKASTALSTFNTVAVICLSIVVVGMIVVLYRVRRGLGVSLIATFGYRYTAVDTSSSHGDNTHSSSNNSSNNSNSSYSSHSSNREGDIDPSSSSSSSYIGGISAVEIESNPFTIPLFPVFPMIGILINYYLLCQLSPEGYLSIFIYFSLAILGYMSYGYRYRKPFRGTTADDHHYNSNNNNSNNNSSTTSSSGISSGSSGVRDGLIDGLEGGEGPGTRVEMIDISNSSSSNPIYSHSISHINNINNNSSSNNNSSNNNNSSSSGLVVEGKYMALSTS